MNLNGIHVTGLLPSDKTNGDFQILVDGKVIKSFSRKEVEDVAPVHLWMKHEEHKDYMAWSLLQEMYIDYQFAWNVDDMDISTESQLFPVHLRLPVKESDARRQYLKELKKQPETIQKYNFAPTRCNEFVTQLYAWALVIDPILIKRATKAGEKETVRRMYRQNAPYMEIFDVIHDYYQDPKNCTTSRL